MVITLTGFFSLFKDAGLSVASVQRETLTHEQISTLFWINTAVGALLMIAVAAAGPLLAVFYKEPRLLWITVASATVFLLNSLAVQHRALLDRSMQFTTSAKIEILSSVFGTVVAIGMAALGCGYWSLIVQTISLYVVGMVASWIAMPWMPGKPHWTPELRSMVRFGGTVTLNSLVVYLGYNTEKVLLGRFWGPASLGLYGRAYQIGNLPVQQLTNSMGSVAFPDDVALTGRFRAFEAVLFEITFPCRFVDCSRRHYVRPVFGSDCRRRSRAEVERYSSHSTVAFARHFGIRTDEPAVMAASCNRASRAEPENRSVSSSRDDHRRGCRATARTNRCCDRVFHCHGSFGRALDCMGKARNGNNERRLLGRH